MKVHVTIPGHGEVKFTSVIPATLSNYKLAGSVVYAAETEKVTMMVQEISAPANSAWLCVFKCHEDTKLEVSLAKPIFKMQFSLLGDFHRYYEGLGHFSLRQRHCNMYYLPFLNGYGTFKKGQTYEFLEIGYSEQMAGSLFEFFTDMKPFFEKIHNKKAASLLPTERHITAEMMAIINLAKKYGHSSKLLHFYESNLFNNLLMLFLLDVYDQGFDRSEKLPINVDLFLDAEAMIRSNLSSPPNTNVIADRLKMSESRLIRGFKRMFGEAPAAYSRNLRLQKAEDLLLQSTLSVKEIAGKVGFTNDSSFIAKFKETHDGVTPDEWRKKNNQ